MDFLTAYLTQTATLWSKTGRDGYGNPTFAAPVQIPCRWERRTEQVKSVSGDIILSRARVFLDRDVELGDYLFLGTSATADPRDVATAFEVLDFKSTPSLEGTSFERKAYC